MKKVIIAVLLFPYIILEVIFTLIFGVGFGVYHYSGALLKLYESMGFESYVRFIANYESDSGRCKRFYY